MGAASSVMPPNAADARQQWCVPCFIKSSTVRLTYTSILGSFRFHITLQRGRESPHPCNKDGTPGLRLVPLHCTTSCRTQVRTCRSCRIFSRASAAPSSQRGGG